MVLLLSSHLFGNIATIGVPGMFWYGAVIFLSIYSYTELLDKNRQAFNWEFIKNGLALGIMYVQKDWFGISAVFSGAQYFLIAYFLISAGMSGYWVIRNSMEETNTIQ